MVEQPLVDFAISVLFRHVGPADALKPLPFALADDRLRALAAKKTQQFPGALFIPGGCRNGVTPSADPTDWFPPGGKCCGRHGRHRHRVIQIATKLRELLRENPISVDFQGRASLHKWVDFAWRHAELTGLDAASKCISAFGAAN